jgi:hypothetical protein
MLKLKTTQEILFGYIGFPCSLSEGSLIEVEDHPGGINIGNYLWVNIPKECVSIMGAEEEHPVRQHSRIKVLLKGDDFLPYCNHEDGSPFDIYAFMFKEKNKRS